MENIIYNELRTRGYHVDVFKDISLGKLSYATTPCIEADVQDDSSNTTNTISNNIIFGPCIYSDHYELYKVPHCNLHNKSQLILENPPHQKLHSYNKLNA